MSKFYLPTQKGGELFPTTIVAPPIMRWVGIDARTAEAQAIIDTFGSTITAFHMQQAHNHSLSLNTQSRGFLQIAPNIGVEYVNQGGMEYITISVQPQAKAEQPEVKSEEPVVAGPCWYPMNEIAGTVALSENLQFVDLPLVTRTVYGQPDPGLPRSIQVVSGTVSLNFSEPLRIYDQSVTEIGVAGAIPVIWLGAECQTGSSTSNDGTYSTPNSAGVPMLGADFSGFGQPDSYYDVGSNRVLQTVTSVSMARGVIESYPGGQSRSYLVLRWSVRSSAWYVYAPNDIDIYEYDYEMTIVEALRRPGRPACPALIGVSRIRYDYTPAGYPVQDYNFYNMSMAVRQADWSILGYLASTYDVGQFPAYNTLFRGAPYPPAWFSTGSQVQNPYNSTAYIGVDPPITRTWVAFDPDTGKAVSLSPDFRWGDDRATPWPPDKTFSGTVFG